MIIILEVPLLKVKGVRGFREIKGREINVLNYLIRARYFLKNFLLRNGKSRGYVFEYRQR